jgi:AcrR family transcriptional regulator
MGALFTIGELVLQTRVPATTIHHYRHLGLLPPVVPLARNRYLYGQQHVRAINTIRRLRVGRQLPLPVIARVLPGLLEAAGPEDDPMWEETIELEGCEAPRDARCQLVIAARQAFSARSYGEVTVDDVCAAAAVAKGTFYRHFATKEDVFLAAAAAVVDDAAAALARIGHPPNAAVLDEVVGPRLPLLLELVRRALQPQSACAARAREIFDRLDAVVGGCFDCPDEQADVGVLESAFARIIRSALQRA